MKIFWFYSDREQKLQYRKGDLQIAWKNVLYIKIKTRIPFIKKTHQLKYMVDISEFIDKDDPFVIVRLKEVEGQLVPLTTEEKVEMESILKTMKGEGN